MKLKLKQRQMVSCFCTRRLLAKSELIVSKTGKMAETKLVIFCLILATESFLICVGNAFTIFVFWNRRSAGPLRRTCYLLLNLAVIDFLVGLTEPISLATKTIPFFLKKPTTFDDVHDNGIGYLLSSFFVTFSMMSVVCLSVISLERAFAVLRPFLHRTTTIKIYIYSIIFIWTAGVGLAVIYALPAFQLWDKIYSSLAMNSVVILCLIFICTTYFKIHYHLKRPPKMFSECTQRQNMEANAVKLSKTLFIVIGLSFAFWFAAVVLYTLVDLCFNCIPTDVMWIGTALHLCNSLVNPITYSYRMPIFRKTLKRLLTRRKPENVEQSKF